MKKKDKLAHEAKKIRQVLTMILGVLLVHLGIGMDGGGLIAQTLAYSGLAVLAVGALRVIWAVLYGLGKAIEPEPEESEDEWGLTPTPESES